MVWLSSRDVTVPAKAMLKSKKLTPRFFGPYQVERFDAPATVKLKWTNNKSKVWPFLEGNAAGLRPRCLSDPCSCVAREACHPSFPYCGT
jgi:hypothetical protein